MTLVTVKQLKDARRYAIVAIFVVVAVVMPPDIVWQLALGIPLCILYELGILLFGWVEDERNRLK